MPAKPSRSQTLSDEIDVTYEIEMPFNTRPAKVNLINRDNEIEVLISGLPRPAGYHDVGGGDKSKIRRNAVSRWILEDAARVLDKYEWSTSSRVSNQGHRYLNDLYYICDQNEVDDAVLAAKQFLTKFETKVVKHAQKYDFNLQETPSTALEAN